MATTQIEDWEPYRNADQLRELMPAWFNQLQCGIDAKNKPNEAMTAARLKGKYRAALVETAKNARIWGLDPMPIYQLIDIDDDKNHPDFHPAWEKAGNLVMKCRVEAKARWEIMRLKGEEQSKPVVPSLDAEELLILRLLDSSNSMLTLVEIETRTYISRKTAGIRLKRLRELGFTHRPKGNRGGEAITDAGRRFLKL